MVTQSRAIDTIRRAGRLRGAAWLLAAGLLLGGCGEAATAERPERAGDGDDAPAGVEPGAVETEMDGATDGARDAGAGGAVPAPGAREGVAMELDAVLSATERFRDVEVALSEGFVRDPTDMCAMAGDEGLPRQLGGMGIHFFRPDLLRLTATEPRVAGEGIHTDFLEPAVLAYEPRADGSLELVAVENIVFAEAWRAAGHEEPPLFLGNQYHYRHDNPETEVDEAHGFEPHWELHVWLYRSNPSGTFAQYNPAVTCEHHRPGNAGAGRAARSG